MAARRFLGYASAPLAIGLFQNSSSNEFYLVRCYGFFDDAITPLKQIRAQLLDIFSRRRELLVLPIWVFRTGGGVVVRARFEVPCSPLRATLGWHKIDLWVVFKYRLHRLACHFIMAVHGSNSIGTVVIAPHLQNEQDPQCSCEARLPQTLIMAMTTVCQMISTHLLETCLC